MTVGDIYKTFILNQSICNVKVCRIVGNNVLCHNVSFVSFFDLFFDVDGLQGQSGANVDLSINCHVPFIAVAVAIAVVIVVDFQDSV